MYGPSHPVSVSQHAEKYRRHKDETFMEMAHRIASVLTDSDEHYRDYYMTILHQRFMPAGRVQRAIGTDYLVCAHNCFVSGGIEDTSESILDKVKEAFMTMRMGGGIGYDFGGLRPRGAPISTLGSSSSGAVSFMQIFDAACKAVRSAGGRRGAQMAVLPIWHPDIEEFIDAKTKLREDDAAMVAQIVGNRSDGESLDLAISQAVLQTKLSAFNVSVGVTDDFMRAVKDDGDFALVFKDKEYKRVRARTLWDRLMRATWDWAEPGVLFIDTINRMNNLYYCETINATNPCGEQPLPPYGACLLGSFALPNYVRKHGGAYHFDYEAFRHDIPGVVRAMDNVIDETRYPLPQQREEALAKRRMGLGVTGTANAIEALGHPYGTDGYLEVQRQILRILVNVAYSASALLAKEKGPFPLYDRQYICGGFFRSPALTDSTRRMIRKHGLRNSHLTSIAPTGTISLTADNMSSGIEPVFSYSVRRTILDNGGNKTTQEIEDYGLREYGVKGRRAIDLSAREHCRVYTEAQQFVDSAVSKTVNVGPSVSFEEFKTLYFDAWEAGAKGCATFRIGGKRFGVLSSLDADAAVCSYDPETGERTGDCAEG